MPLMGIHWDFEGKDREVECIKVYEKPQWKKNRIGIILCDFIYPKTI